LLYYVSSVFWVKIYTKNGNIYTDTYIYTAVSNKKWKPRHFVVCQFVDEETNGRYLFANGLNGLAYL
jgi:hypothetical protein